MESSFAVNVVPMAPADPLFGLMAQYKEDTFPKKVDLGIGAYRDDNAKPVILTSVAKADEQIHRDPTFNHEYLGISGLPGFTTAAQQVILGSDSRAVREKRACAVQSISGTGALRLGSAFLSKFYPKAKQVPVLLSSPTWANHNQVFQNAGHPIQTYPYFHKETKGLDFDGMIGSISAAPEGSIVVLHACAHNPTGVDPTQDQWKRIAEVVGQKKHFPFFDCAYQGFASGDLDRDAWAVRHFVEKGFEMCIAQSFAKNLGLYGERVGCFHFVAAPGTDGEHTAARVASQLAILQRSEISNPPAYGAKIASTILNDTSLFSEWDKNLKEMSGRIIDMRKQLRAELERLGTPGTWSHITDQIGMFSFTGLTEEQVLKVRADAHVYMTKNGRASIAGLNTNNVKYVAEAIDKAVRATTAAPN